jgi:hypothetical protein
MRLDLVSTNDQSSGNSDYYGSNFTAGTAWQQVSVPASGFTTIGFGTAGTFSAVEQTALQFQWQTENTANSGVTLWLDEICMHGP